MSHPSHSPSKAPTRRSHPAARPLTVFAEKHLFLGSKVLDELRILIRLAKPLPSNSEIRFADLAERARQAASPCGSEAQNLPGTKAA